MVPRAKPAPGRQTTRKPFDSSTFDHQYALHSAVHCESRLHFIMRAPTKSVISYLIFAQAKKPLAVAFALYEVD